MAQEIKQDRHRILERLYQNKRGFDNKNRRIQRENDQQKIRVLVEQLSKARKNNTQSFCSFKGTTFLKVKLNLPFLNIYFSS